MLLPTLLVSLAASPVQSGLYSAHLLPREQVLQPVLANGFDTYRAVRQVVTGSVLTALGGVFGGLGAYALLSAIPETGTTRTVYTALGWSSLGFGIILGAVGIPLIIVGAVRLAIATAWRSRWARTAGSRSASERQPLLNSGSSASCACVSARTSA
ncbi:MAG: hypothetical protein ACOZQL_03635 [Myxococcota bacterium]